MEAQDALVVAERNVPNRILGSEDAYGILGKWGLLFASLLVLWLSKRPTVAAHRWGAEVYAVALYAITNVLFTLPVLLSGLFATRVAEPSFLATIWNMLRNQLRAASSLHNALLSISYLIDYLYVTALIALVGGPYSDLYLLYGFLALKSAIYYPFIRELVLVPFLSGVLWIAGSYVYADSLYFLVDRGFLLRYVTLFFFIVGALALGWLMEHRQRWISALDANLSRKSEDLEHQSHIVQRMASELANRLLELRSLQEGVKAVNSALTLDELLQLIVENATQVLRGARCTVELVDEQRAAVVTSAAAGIRKEELWGTSFPIGQGVSGWVVANRQPALIRSVSQDTRFQKVGNWPIASLICVPLISEGQVIGTLTATSPEPDAFTEGDVSLLDAFGDQAAVAVKNARLYEQLVQEEKETARLYQSVLEKSNKLEAILRGIGDGVIVIDPNLQLLMMNPVAAKMLDVRQTPKPGVRLPEIVTHQAILDLARNTLADPDMPLIREVTLQRDADRAQTYQALASVARGADDRPRGVVVVMRDITDQKELEQMKSNFLSVVSHELRTPLHSIKGFVDIILMGKTGAINDLQRDFLTTVKEATSNLQRLIDDLLEFSRMEAGRIQLRPEMISIYDVAERVVEQLMPLAQEHGLELHNQVPEEIDLIEADPMRIEQVLTNLVSNAIKFTPQDGSITVSAVDLGSQVQVSVADTGIGIPEEEHERIFQRFYQVDSSVTRAYHGAGLGLTICRFIVEYHHGRIWVESQTNQGSTFHFVLPKELPRDEALVVDFTIPADKRR